MLRFIQASWRNKTYITSTFLFFFNHVNYLVNYFPIELTAKRMSCASHSLLTSDSFALNGQWQISLPSAPKRNDEKTTAKQWFQGERNLNTEIHALMFTPASIASVSFFLLLVYLVIAIIVAAYFLFHDKWFWLLNNGLNVSRGEDEDFSEIASSDKLQVCEALWLA